jgi:hypothetical protein
MPLHDTRGAASAFGFGFASGGSGLYPFTSFTFLPAETISPNGPLLAQVLALPSYIAEPWTSDTNFFNVTSGVQYWTVPKTGIYSFLLSGAAGGDATQADGTSPPTRLGGFSAIVGGRYQLTQGEIIKILVGQMGGSIVFNYSGGGGGGGSYVATNANVPLFVAAGGQGACSDTETQYGQNGPNGSFTGEKNAAVVYAEGGAAGGANGGAIGQGGIIDETASQRNSAGGGFYTDGAPSNLNPFGLGTAGLSFINNGQGAVYTGTEGSGTNGGYGGGTAAAVRKGGAGGGYSGGNGASTTGVGQCNAIGASATSYLTEVATNTVAYQASTRAAGYVTVTFIS